MEDDENIINCGTTSFSSTDKVLPSTIFDLASLTKPLVTTLVALSLVDSEKLAWNELLGTLLHTSIPEPLRDADIYSLLNHSSGLAAHRVFWKGAIRQEEETRRNWFLKKIVQQKVEYKQGSRHVYSDLGYMLLGFIIEERTGKRLDLLWSDIVAKPLGIENELFFPGYYVKSGDELLHSFAVTGQCGWSGDILQGIVHDDNCRSIGGVCGHAGLFGSARAILVLCKELLALYKGETSRLSIKRDTFLFACRRVGGSEWTGGFNLPSKNGSSAGIYFSPESIGHLGFTGTSFWIDLEKELIVILLTNRVIAGDDQKGIKELRQEVHNYLAEQLEKKGKKSPEKDNPGDYVLPLPPANGLVGGKNFINKGAVVRIVSREIKGV